MVENTQQEKQKPNEVKEMAKKLRITPFSRMIGQYYVGMGYIDESEKDDFLRELNQSSDNKLVQRINSFLSALCNSYVGALFAPMLVKFSEKMARSLDYASEMDEMQAEAERKIAARFMERLSN